MRALWFLALLLVSAPTIAQMCPGDLNGDHAVTIDELVTALRSSLEGCEASPSPTPGPLTECTAAFDERNTRECRFIGPVNALPGCGERDEPVTYTTDGSTIQFHFTQHDLVAVGRVTSPTTAELGLWFAGGKVELFPLAGRAELLRPGDRLRIDPEGVPFQVGTCAFERYDGVFVSR